MIRKEQDKFGASADADRATHEPSPDGLGHTVSVPSARLKLWGYAMAEAAGWLRAAGELDNDPDAASISKRLTGYYAEVASFLDEPQVSEAGTQP